MSCTAALNLKGEHFPCDVPTDEGGTHGGWAHGNKSAQAIWAGGSPEDDEPDDVERYDVINHTPRDGDR